MTEPESKNRKPVLRILAAAGGVLLCFLLLFFKIEEISEWMIAKKADLFSRISETSNTSPEMFDSYEPLTDEPDAWYLEDDLMVAHACGGIDAIRYTNSREALETAVEHGFTLIEADFILTADDVVVLRHGWSHDLEQDDFVEPDTVLDAKQHSETPVFYKYHAQTFSEFKAYLVRHPELRLVVDCGDVHALELIVEECLADGDAELLDRFLVQFYSPEDHALRKQVYPFQNWIYTTYRVDTDFYDAVRYCLEQNIHVLATPYSTLNHVPDESIAALHDKHLHLMTYSINSIRECRQLYQRGVEGFYTDFLVPSDMEIIKKP